MLSLATNVVGRLIVIGRGAGDDGTDNQQSIGMRKDHIVNLSRLFQVMSVTLLVAVVGACSSDEPTVDLPATPSATSIPTLVNPTPTPQSIGSATPTRQPTATPTNTPQEGLDTTRFETPTPQATPTATTTPSELETGALRNTRIVYKVSRTDGIHWIETVLPSGNDRQEIYSSAFGLGHPRWSPDRSRLAFITVDEFNVRAFVITDRLGNTTATQRSWACVSCDPYVQWLEDPGRLYVTSGNGVMEHYTATGVTTSSDILPVAQLPALGDFAGFDLKDGSNFLVSSNFNGNWDLYADLGLTRLTTTPYDEVDARWSPDGKNVVFAANADGDFDLFILGLDSGSLRQIANSPGDDIEPTWSPDGKFIAFASNRNGDYDLFVTTTDGELIFLQTLADGPGDERSPDWESLAP